MASVDLFCSWVRAADALPGVVLVELVGRWLYAGLRGVVVAPSAKPKRFGEPVADGGAFLRKRRFPAWYPGSYFGSCARFAMRFVRVGHALPLEF